MSQKYDFDRGLANGQKLEILAGDPVFSALVAGVAPEVGVRTKRSITNAKGMLLFGAGTVLFGSDRSAEAEMSYQWTRLASALKRAGVEVSADPPTASSWRYYREAYLTEAVVEEMMGAVRVMWANQAIEMGLFPTADSDHDWMEPDHLHSVYADGTWFAPASRTGIRGQKSRATTGEPRLSEGLSVGGKLDGYCSVWMLARRPESRMRVVLDFANAPAGGELPVVIDSLERLRSTVGDGLRHFAYDRALRGHDQITRIVEMGILPIGKPDGVDSFADWDVRGQPLRSGVLNFEYDFDGCVHRLAADYGMLWHLDHDGRNWTYTKRADVECIERIEKSDGTYTFELVLTLRCRSSSHLLRVDLTGPLVVDEGRRRVRLAAHLKAHPMADTERFAAAYGIRNDAESGFSLFKNHLGIGPRAGSYTALGHKIDLMLLALTANALTWAEWKQVYRSESAA